MAIRFQHRTWNARKIAVTDPTAPKVFVSHASEDKAFVLQLAQRLREDGVDAWVDKWEILVGDKLIDKIFTEGIGACDAFLIALSRASVQKPWVQEELDAGFVEAIERKTKLLSIRLDDCAVPVVLTSRRWLNINPSGDYEAEYKDLLAAIFDKRERPALGKPAAHLLNQAPGYSADETAIWDLLVRLVAEHGPARVPAAALAKDLPHIERTKMAEAIKALEHDRLVQVQRYAGGNFHAMLTPSGWHGRADEALGIDVQDDEHRALANLVSDGDCSGEDLLTRTSVETVRLIMATEYLEVVGLVKIMKVNGRGVHAYAHIRCTPEGKRRLRESQ